MSQLPDNHLPYPVAPMAGPNQIGSSWQTELHPISFGRVMGFQRVILLGKAEGELRQGCSTTANGATPLPGEGLESTPSRPSARVPGDRG